MNNTSCDQLDDYLADSLADGERARFEAHLANCPVCRKEVEHQRIIDRLLVQGTEQFDPVPPSLVDFIESAIQSRQRLRMVRLAWGLSTAAAIILLVGLWSVSQRDGFSPEPRPVAERKEKPPAFARDIDPAASNPATSNPARAEPVVRVVSSDPSAAILVPMKTTAHNVSIVWVYPTTKFTTLANDSETN